MAFVRSVFGVPNIVGTTLLQASGGIPVISSNSNTGSLYNTGTDKQYPGTVSGDNQITRSSDGTLKFNAYNSNACYFDSANTIKPKNISVLVLLRL